MTTYPHTRAQDPPIARAGRVPSPVAPSTGDLAFGLIDAFSGAGLAFMGFLAAVHGLLPAVIVTVLLIAPLFVPLLVVGAAAVSSSASFEWRPGHSRSRPRRSGACPARG